MMSLSSFEASEICFVDLCDFFHLSTKPLGKQILVISQVIRASGGNLCTPGELGSISCSSREGSLMFFADCICVSCWVRFCGGTQLLPLLCYTCTWPCVVGRAGVNQCKQQPCSTIDEILGNKGQFDVVWASHKQNFLFPDYRWRRRDHWSQPGN